jgi:hypothetical protein
MHVLKHTALSYLNNENFSDKVIHKNKTQFGPIIFFLENLAFYEIMWKKYCIAGQATDDSMVHGRCMLDT